MAVKPGHGSRRARPEKTRRISAGNGPDEVLAAGADVVGVSGSIQHPPELSDPTPNPEMTTADAHCEVGSARSNAAACSRAGVGPWSIPRWSPEHLVEHGVAEHLAVVGDRHRLPAHERGPVDHGRGAAERYEP